MAVNQGRIAASLFPVAYLDTAFSIVVLPVSASMDRYEKTQIASISPI